MTTRAYDRSYIGKASRAVGNMLHCAVAEHSFDGGDFLKRFVQSGIAGEIEHGNPKYTAGMSGRELFLEVIERTSDADESARLNGMRAPESYERSEYYWVGWMITHYQWFSGRSFDDITAAVPYGELLCLYDTLHEADIQKSYEVMDERLSAGERKLKRVRQMCGMTQKELSEASGVAVSTIRAYEQGSKDIRKAQVDIISRMASALKCDISDIIG